MHMFLSVNNVTCTCNKVYKSVSGHQRYKVVHKHQIIQTDQINIVGRASFLCHICFRLCGSVAELMDHLRGHKRSYTDGGGVRL